MQDPTRRARCGWPVSGNNALMIFEAGRTNAANASASRIANDSREALASLYAQNESAGRGGNA